MTLRDFSEALTIRRSECRATNPAFYSSVLSNFFGSGNCGLMHEITGGDRDTLRAWVGSDGIERFTTTWRTSCRQRFGTSIIRAQYLMAVIELGVRSDSKAVRTF